MGINGSQIYSLDNILEDTDSARCISCRFTVISAYTVADVGLKGVVGLNGFTDNPGVSKGLKTHPISDLSK